MITRRDVRGIDAGAEREVLARRGLAADDLLGQGTEARVYAADPATVLKIYGDPRQRGSLETLQDFYRRLDAGGLPYELPLIQEISEDQGLLLVLERRIDGRPMTDYRRIGQPGLEGVYLDAALAMSTVRVDPPLGRFLLLGPGDDGTQDWHCFVTALIDRKLPGIRPFLSVDVPDFDRRTELLRRRFSRPYRGEIRLVHGDICPANVLMHGPETVSGIIDFGTCTMQGDPLFDVASACGYYDMYGPDRVATRDRLLATAAGRSGDEPSLVAYLLIAALVTCDLYPEPGTAVRAGGHYRWAAEILRDDRYWDRIG
jgi:hypothetical protein